MIPDEDDMVDYEGLLPAWAHLERYCKNDVEAEAAMAGDYSQIEERIVVDLETRSNAPMRLLSPTGRISRHLVQHTPQRELGQSLGDILASALRRHPTHAYKLPVQVDNTGQLHFLGALGFDSDRITKRQRDEYAIVLVDRQKWAYFTFQVERDKANG